MDGSASRPRHCLYLEQAREVVRGNERTYRQAERLADGVLHTLHSVQDRRGVILTSRRRSGKITVGDDDPNRMDNATWETEAIEPPENLQ
jgi:hypothetical protein